jgi:biotin carboxylase
MRLDALDAAAQALKRVYACAGHAPLLRNFSRHVRSEMNPRLAQLFMICSNIKLR